MRTQIIFGEVEDSEPGIVTCCYGCFMTVLIVSSIVVTVGSFMAVDRDNKAHVALGEDMQYYGMVCIGALFAILTATCAAAITFTIRDRLRVHRSDVTLVI